MLKIYLTVSDQPGFTETDLGHVGQITNIISVIEATAAALPNAKIEIRITKATTKDELTLTDAFLLASREVNRKSRNWQVLHYPNAKFRRSYEVPRGKYSLRVE